MLNPDLPELKMPITITPNPLRTSSVIHYQLPESGQLTIHAYDINGKDCGILFTGYQQKGKQQFIINKNPGMQIPGIYFISVILKQNQKIIKLLISN